MDLKKISLFIGQHEGFRSHRYADPCGNSTIGYGHLCTSSSPYQITRDEADRLLISDIEVRIAEIRGHFKRLFGLDDVFETLSDNQSTALVSFVFNLGIGRIGTFDALLAIYSRCTFLTKQERDCLLNYICNAMSVFVHGKINGRTVVLPGLECRRKEEIQLMRS